METILLPHLPDYPLRACLFKQVKNASFLRQQLLDGNTEFEYAFLDGSVLLSRNHVLGACFRAINDMLNGRMKSRNVHSEVVFSLSPNNNISESFRRFGISEDSTNVLAIKVGGDAAQIEAHLMQHVHGEMTAFSDEAVAELCDPGRIQKIYRVDLRQKGDVEVTRKEAEASILGSIALKGS